MRLNNWTATQSSGRFHPREKLLHGTGLFPALASCFERVNSRAAMQRSCEIAESINTAPMVGENANTIWLGQITNYQYCHLIRS
jgi:hypothetical protein